MEKAARPAGRARSFAALALTCLVALLLAPPRAAALDIDHIDIRDYRLRIACEGVGSPTVVMDSGLGGSSLEWVYVSGRLREITRVCVYDRAGYGGSDTGPLPRTSSRIANELYLLLDGAVVSPPFILVGHSFGGYNMQLFARRYPYLAAGLVLVDASHPEQVERFFEPPLNLLTAPSSRHGIVQFRDPPPPHVMLPATTKRQMMMRGSRWKTRRTLASELLSFRDSAEELRLAGPPADLPLIVVTRGRMDGGDSPRRRMIEQLWLRLQSELAAQSATSAHIVARRSGHHVHIEQPDVVAFAVAMLVDRYRAGRREDVGFDEQSARDRFPLDDVAWLRDSLNLYPMTVVAHRFESECRAVRCATQGDGAP